MAVLERDNVVLSDQGFEKEIDAGAKELIIDNVQANQYQYPIKSTVRELCSNSLDAINEKIQAINILTGKSKVTDYYIIRESDNPLYKDSNFDPTYYDLDFLDTEDNMVHITYIEGKGDNKDMLEILDKGVGLGGKRLEGYFRLGFSTKRNSHNPLGKFGIGAKAAFSTNVPYYTMETAWNGKKFKFHIFAHKVDSIIPAFNLNTGEENPSVTFENGYVAHYEETKEKNYVKVSMECKKGHRYQYEEAVKSQLLYFKNINFNIVEENGITREIPVTTEILYEDDHIVLSSNNIFNKPHLIINNVNYGYIDFVEMEMEELSGNIGIKVDASKVDVNPSRESVRWTPKTTDTVKESFRKVVEIATKHVEEMLSGSMDIIEWINACKNVMYSSDRNSVLGRLSRVIDKTKISPKYPGDDTLVFSGVDELFSDFSVRVAHIKREKGVRKVLRTDIGGWMEFPPKNIYLLDSEERVDFVKDMFLLDSLGGHPIILIQLKEKDDREPHTDKLLDLLKNSVNVTLYSSVIVPDDIRQEITKKRETEEALREDPVERRRREEKIPISFLRNTYKYNTNYYLYPDEVKLSDLEDIDESEVTIVYGINEDLDLLYYISFMTGMYLDNIDTKDLKYKTYILGNLDLTLPTSEKGRIAFVRISKENAKYFNRFTYVRDFIYDIKDGVITLNIIFKSLWFRHILESNIDVYTKSMFTYDMTQECIHDLYDMYSRVNNLYKKRTSYSNVNINNSKGTARNDYNHVHDYVTKFMSTLLSLQIKKESGLSIDKDIENTFHIKGVHSIDFIDMEHYKLLIKLLEIQETVPLYKYITHHVPYRDLLENPASFADIMDYLRSRKILK